MKTHSQEFKDNIALLGKQQEVKVTYTENDEEKVLTGEDINSATPHYEGNLLKSVMKELDLDSNVDIPKDTEVNFKHGILIREADLKYKEIEGTEIEIQDATQEKIDKFKLFGKSEQATRSGKNLLHLNETQTKNGITVTNNNDGTITINGTATVSMDIWIANGLQYSASNYKQSFSINDTFTQKRNIISGSSTGKWELRTISYNEDTSQYIWGTIVNDTTFTAQYNGETRAVELLIQNGTVFEELRIFPQLERGTVATTPEMYGASPSPDYPSEIHSVADDVNLFDVTNKTATLGGASYTAKNGEIIINGQSTQNASIAVGKVYLKANTNYYFSYNNNNSLNSSYFVFNDHGTYIYLNQDRTFTVSQDGEYESNFILISGTYSNLIIRPKFQKGTVATSYSPYNQGTVTIKQRGKNLIDNNNLQYDFSNVPNTYNQLETIETGIRYSTTYSSGTPTIIFNTGIDLTSHIGKTIKMKSTISSNAGSIRVGIANADTSLRQYKANTNISNEEISFLVTDDLGEKKYLIYYLAIDVGIGNTADFKNLTLTIDEEPIYEPYQANDFTFQTSPLRSLPNGVKDTIEADGIHRRIYSLLLNGSEDWSLYNTSGNINQLKVNITNNYEKYSGNEATSTSMLCNYFVPTNYSGYWVRNNTILFAVKHQLFIQTEMDLSSFKTWLSTHNTEVIYELATEVIEPFTEEQMEVLGSIQTFEGYNNFTTTDDLKPTFSFGYSTSSEEYDYEKIIRDYEYLDYGNYIVYSSEKQEDTYSYKIKCYDKMLYSMKPYENMNITYPITIRNYINALCNYLGLTFANASNTFTNYDKEIPNELYLSHNEDTQEWEDIGYNFRDVFDELAQVTGSVICINKDDKIEIRYPNETNDTIDEEYLKDVNVNFGEKYGPINTVIFSRSEGSDKITQSIPANLPDNEKIAIEIADNQILNFNNRVQYLGELLTRLYGTEYYINDFTSTGIVYYDLLDKYNVQIGENTYNCLMLNDEINITQGIEETIHTEILQESQTDYSKTDKTDRKINQTYLIVDKQNQRIDSVITNVTEQNNKISQITQTVDELNSKISDIADITIAGESMIAVVQLDNINQSEPIEIRVRPITENISYLYPKNNLYPSDNLYMKERKIRFVRTYEEDGETKTENIDYEIPDDLLYYDSNTYDEFYLNYNSETCQIIKKCKYNADGTVGLLSITETTDYEYPQILLGDGDYQIQLLGYDIGYISVRLMAQNIYTTQFATKAELSSSITQTANEINLRVDEKLDEEDFTSANIMLKINNDESQATINADKINLNGVVTANNNFKILSDGSMESVNGKFTGGTINMTDNSNQGKNNNIIITNSNNSQITNSIGSTGLLCKRNNASINMYVGDDMTYAFWGSGDKYPRFDYGVSLTTSNNGVGISVIENTSQTYVSSIDSRSITTNTVYYKNLVKNSKESVKKNIELYNTNAIQKIKNSQLYTYNYITESDNNKKHIGFIIGDNGGNYKTPNEVINETREGIDVDNMTSILWKAVQEQQEIIEDLQKQINELKGDK